MLECQPLSIDQLQASAPSEQEQIKQKNNAGLKF